jgi:hypothetical protein
MGIFKRAVFAKYLVVAEEYPDFLYHVTYASRLDDIAKHGLTPNAPRSIGGMSYDSQSKGKVFLTEFSGVDYWMSKAEDFANHNSDHPLTDLYVPVVLQVYHDDLGDLLEDEIGSKDSTHKAWFVHKTIPASNLTVWSGKSWVDLDSELDFSQAFDIEEEEDGESLEFFKATSPFLPSHED